MMLWVKVLSAHLRLKKIEQHTEEYHFLERHHIELSAPSRTGKVRYILAMFTMFQVFYAYATRAVLSVVIIQISLENELLTDNTRNIQWNSLTQGFVLGSFYVGYAVSQIPGSLAAYKYGSKKLIGLGTFCIALCNIITPITTVTFGANGIIILRILQGIADGLTFPCLMCFLSKWSPENERSFLTSISMTGIYTGTLIAMSVSAYIIKWSGWNTVYYIYGSFGVLWYILWVFVSSESPEDHPFITEKERAYIIQTRNMNLSTNVLKIPWKSMFRSLPFYAISIGLFCQDWGACLLMAIQPTYLYKGLEYSLSKSSIYSGIPYIVQPVIMAIGGKFADLVYERRYTSLTNVRKGTVIIAFLGQFLFLVASLQFTDSNYSDSFISMDIKKLQESVTQSIYSNCTNSSSSQTLGSQKLGEGSFNLPSSSVFLFNGDVTYHLNHSSQLRSSGSFLFLKSIVCFSSILFFFFRFFRSMIYEFSIIIIYLHYLLLSLGIGGSLNPTKKKIYFVDYLTESQWEHNTFKHPYL
ncbi:Vesicular glutamate transporter 3 [Nymphon striatum]|nr:Vesicular glutamate transporter 3 [Nymphon striatum]